MLPEHEREHDRDGAEAEEHLHGDRAGAEGGVEPVVPRACEEQHVGHAVQVEVGHDGGRH